MKHLLVIIFTLCSLCAFAQENNSEVKIEGSATKSTELKPTLSSTKPEIKSNIADPEFAEKDSTYYLHDYRQWMYSYYPVRYGLGICDYGMPWGLHKGLNISLDASVFACFGSGAPKGVGFGQRITALYVAPLSEHLTAIVGGYFNNTFFSGDNYREGGFYGELTYKFDEHWEASIYGQKSLMNSDARLFMPHYMYDLNHIGDRIGASVRYNFSPSFSVQLNVECDKRPDIKHETPTPPIMSHYYPKAASNQGK